jgi:hypothetical protein
MCSATAAQGGTARADARNPSGVLGVPNAVWVWAATGAGAVVLLHLVDRVHEWPGVNGLTALLAGRPLRATRPLHFFRPDGPMPAELELLLTIPAALGPAAEVLAELRDRVRAVELERAAERARTGRRVLGRRAVRAQSWRGSPTSVESRRTSGPGWRRELSGRGLRRCCTIARLPSSTPLPAIDGETAFLPYPTRHVLAPTVRVGASARDLSSSESLTIAPRIAERDAPTPTPPGASGAWSCPRIDAAISDVLVARGRGPSIAVGL